MFKYKGLTVWFNSCRREKPWLVQSGHQIIGEYRTKGGAKSAITQWENHANRRFHLNQPARNA